MISKKESLITISSWVIGSLVILLALLAWASVRLNGGELTIYDIFPVLGLCAFSIMWTHYIVGFVRRFYNVSPQVNAQYFKYTSTLVLALILLHPGLLFFGLFKDGFGLPPQSTLQVYSAPMMKGAIMIGTISLFIFLAFELKKRFRKKSWWRFVEYAQVLAMFLIIYHAFTLGGELDVAWYKAIWFFYAVSLVIAIAYNYWYDYRVKRR